MTLHQIYTQFLSSPTPAVLAEGATLNYVPTLTSISEPAAILKHLTAQAKLLTKKKESVISSVEADGSLALEVDTTIEFVSGGGAYLPGLDDNFLADQIVQIPVVHIVQFDNLQKIAQIRLYWDQGSLLKSIEVIGSRGRNWPLRHGVDQVRLIAGSVSAVSSQQAGGVSSRRSTTSQQSQTSAAAQRSTASHDADATPRNNRGAVAPRMSAKPPSRDLADILAGNDDVQMPGSPDNRPVSPTKRMEGAPKMGAGKNYLPSRLFDRNGGADQPSPEKSAIKLHDQKYKHFEFGNGEGVVQGNIRSRAKHESQWDFADFATPSKPKVKGNPKNDRSASWSDEEEQRPQSPVRREIVHHARPSNEAHFDISDEVTPGKEQSRPSSQHQNNNMGLYTDNVTIDTPSSKLGKPMPLTTNLNLSNRNKDFGSHFDIPDKVPAAETAQEQQPKKENRGIRLGGNGMGGRKESNNNWFFGGDEAVEAANAADRTNMANKPDRGIRLGGNGMGGRKGTGASWAMGDGGDDDGDADAAQQTQQRKHIAPKTATAGKTAHQRSSNWEF